MTQLRQARAGKITRELELVAVAEGIPPHVLADKVAHGRVVIPANTQRTIERPIGVGEDLTVKVNANIGTSPDHCDPEFELQKLQVAEDAGADAVMDLSVGGDLGAIRRTIIERSRVVLGTVPIYQAVAERLTKQQNISALTADDMFDAVERNAKDGIDFLTIHCGVTRKSLWYLQEEGRTLGIVSRGGSLLAQWIKLTGEENPFFEYFDRLLDIAEQYDITLSLGDGLRPGCLADATDRGQIQELIILGELTQRAWKRNVQVMIEGPGHVPLHQIRTNMELQKRLCHGAPFYVLGPVVTDIAPGYDHITSAIGGALAAWSGADFLCYVTPAEHLRLPDLDDVREGVIVTRIAAHAADLARGKSAAWEWDRKMAVARRDLDWETQIKLSIHPERARAMRSEALPADSDVCSMCGKFCAIKGVESLEPE